jgi:hypothetical protein
MMEDGKTRRHFLKPEARSLKPGHRARGRCG